MGKTFHAGRIRLKQSKGRLIKRRLFNKFFQPNPLSPQRVFFHTFSDLRVRNIYDRVFGIVPRKSKQAYEKVSTKDYLPPLLNILILNQAKVSKIPIHFYIDLSRTQPNFYIHINSQHLCSSTQGFLSSHTPLNFLALSPGLS